ncbi:pilus assembly protein TadG-related protein [Candidatus Poriferisodalis sp.]|uniref:pilus assembly protein TadG-related protein n=1 Tax=Candidatus Poriferisodalis sp. TaxID=3101277 RepID=UPI003B026080
MRGGDERGDFAIFIAVIAAALLLFGSIAYDAPRLMTARQHAVHAANEAARAAAATIAAGGTLSDSRDVADFVLSSRLSPYGATISRLGNLHCVGNRVEVAVSTWYSNRSPLGVFRERQPITARGAAEAVLTGPDGQPTALRHLPECPLVSAGGP